MKKDLLSKKGPEFKDLENVSLSRLQKMRKHALKRIPRVCLTSQLIRVLVWLCTMYLISISAEASLKLVGIIPAKQCWLGLK